MDLIKERFKNQAETIRQEKIKADRIDKLQFIVAYRKEIKRRINIVISDPENIKRFERMRTIIKGIETIHDQTELSTMEKELDLLVKEVYSSSKFNIHECHALSISSPEKKWEREVAQEWHTHWNTGTQVYFPKGTGIRSNFCFNFDKSKSPVALYSDFKGRDIYVDIVKTILETRGWTEKFEINFDPIF
jgi:hypothetical protein